MHLQSLAVAQYVESEIQFLSRQCALGLDTYPQLVSPVCQSCFWCVDLYDWNYFIQNGTSL